MRICPFHMSTAILISLTFRIPADTGTWSGADFAVKITNAQSKNSVVWRLHCSWKSLVELISQFRWCTRCRISWTIRDYASDVQSCLSTLSATLPLARYYEVGVADPLRQLLIMSQKWSQVFGNGETNTSMSAFRLTGLSVRTSIPFIDLRRVRVCTRIDESKPLHQAKYRQNEAMPSKIQAKHRWNEALPSKIS